MRKGVSLENNVYLTKAEMRLLLYFVQFGRCIWCGDMMDVACRRQGGQPGRDFPTFEHIERRDMGGPFDLTNIVLAHAKCNLKRNVEHQKEICEC
jgi:hypothetical protein